ncbi:MAG: hypothetical protein LBU85_08855 [Treponema sp.]|jgi:hypothetical protein|nr:hypothetical protein [Treponema sp.]
MNTEEFRRIYPEEYERQEKMMQEIIKSLPEMPKPLMMQGLVKETLERRA